MSEVKELVEFDLISAGIAEIQEKGNFIPDMSTKEGYEASKRFVLDETTPTRTRLDKAHQTAKSYWKVGGQNVDKKKNEILDLLVAIQKPHQEAYKAKDQEVKDKKAKFEQDIEDKINVFHNFTLFNHGTSDQVSEIIDNCGEIDTVEGFYHRGADAVKAKADAMTYLNDLLMSTVNREAEEKRQADLAEENRLRQIQIDEQQETMRLQQEEMDRQQNEINRVANEAAAKEQAAADEKQRLIDEAERAEQEKQQAIEREEYAKQQAKQAAEQARQAEIKRQTDEREADLLKLKKRESNNKIAQKAHGDIKTHIMNTCGIEEELAVKIVKSLLNFERVTINY